MSLLVRYIASLHFESFDDLRGHFTSKHCNVLVSGKKYMIVPPSDFSVFSEEPIEFRDAINYSVGTILSKIDNTIMCLGFPKTTEIRVGGTCPIEGPIIASEYIYGTIVHYYFDGRRWCLSTNGSLDAYKNYWIGNKSFGTMFDECLRITPFVSKLNIDYTYQFVLQHPQVHLDFTPFPQIYHIGTFDNKTHQYVNVPMHEFKKPRKFCFPDITTLTEHLLSNLDLGFTFYSIANIDTQYPRFKMLHPDFIYKLLVLGNTNNTCFRYLESKAAGRTEELISNFPSFRSIADWTEAVLRNVSDQIFKVYREKHILKKYDLGINYYLTPIVSELHKDYLQTRRNITNEIAYNYLSSLHPKRINFILEGLGWVQIKKQDHRKKTCANIDIDYLHQIFMPTIISELSMDSYENSKYASIDPEMIFCYLIAMDPIDIIDQVEDNRYLIHCITDVKAEIMP